MNRRCCNLLGILLACAITFAPHVGLAAPYAPLDCKKAATPAEKRSAVTMASGKTKRASPRFFLC